MESVAEIAAQLVEAKLACGEIAELREARKIVDDVRRPCVDGAKDNPKCPCMQCPHP